MWDDGVLADDEYGQKFIIDLHNSCGKQIFDHYKRMTDGQVDIQFRKHTSDDLYSMRGLSKSKQICFVIDGTYSMGSDLTKARGAIKNLTKLEFYKEVSVIIYRDHDYPKVIEQYPPEGGFTTRMD